MPIVFKVTSMMKASRAQAAGALSHEFAMYVDDTGKTRFDRSNDYFLPREVRESPVRQNATSRHPRVLVPPNFVRGEIHLEGALVALALSRGLPTVSPAPTAARREWVEQLAELWTGALLRLRSSRAGKGKRGKMVVALKAILSPHPDDTASLTNQYHSAVALLRQLCTATWREYERLHRLPRGSLGWAWAVHLDKDHLHAHCVVFPCTSSGQPLQLCDRLPVPKGETRPGQDGKGRWHPLSLLRETLNARYAAETDRLLRHIPRATLVEQLHRSVGARLVLADARQVALPELRSQATTLALDELHRELGVAAPDREDLAHELDRWALEGIRRLKGLGEGGSPPQSAADPELTWWRRLWIALEWRRRRRSGPETSWDRFAALCQAIVRGEPIGPSRQVLSSIAPRAASEQALAVSLESAPGEPSWARTGRLRLNEWLNQSRELVFRALTTDTLAAVAAEMPFVRSWFAPEALRYEATPQTGASSPVPPATPSEVESYVANTLDRPLTLRLPDLTPPGGRDEALPIMTA